MAVYEWYLSCGFIHPGKAGKQANNARMFKNLTLYKIASAWCPTLESIETSLDATRFEPCGSTQEKSVGWIEPRGEEHGPLVESINGQRILKLMIETRSVPTQALNKKTKEACDHIEATTGRKPGKKETKSLREDALLALLPQAFPRQASVWIWIDLESRLICTDASSQGKIDEVVTALVRSFDGLNLQLVQTKVTAQTAMSQWLTSSSPEDEWPEGFHIERDGELRSNEEDKSVIRFNRHYLLTDEVRKHIAEGMYPTQLALSWEGRIGFMLTDSMQLKKIDFLEGVFEDRSEQSESGFDADVALATGELGKLIPALIGALGGETTLGEVPQHS